MIYFHQELRAEIDFAHNLSSYNNAAKKKKKGVVGGKST